MAAIQSGDDESIQSTGHENVVSREDTLHTTDGRWTWLGDGRGLRLDRSEMDNQYYVTRNLPLLRLGKFTLKIKHSAIPAILVVMDPASEDACRPERPVWTADGV